MPSGACCFSKSEGISQVGEKQSLEMSRLEVSQGCWRWQERMFFGMFGPPCDGLRGFDTPKPLPRRCEGLKVIYVSTEWCLLFFCLIRILIRRFWERIFFVAAFMTWLFVCVCVSQWTWRLFWTWKHCLGFFWNGYLFVETQPNIDKQPCSRST